MWICLWDGILWDGFRKKYGGSGVVICSSVYAVWKCDRDEGTVYYRCQFPYGVCGHDGSIIADIFVDQWNSERGIESGDFLFGGDDTSVCDILGIFRKCIDRYFFLWIYLCTDLCDGVAVKEFACARNSSISTASAIRLCIWGGAFFKMFRAVR